MSFSLQDTTLWKMVVDHSGTTFEAIQDYLTDPHSNDDLSQLRAFVDSLGLSQINGITEKWMVQMILIAKRPMELMVDTKLDVYTRAVHWVDMILENTHNESMSKKTVTLKIVYDDWRKQDIKDQLHVLVEMYLYYHDILQEFDYFLHESADEVYDREKEDIQGQIRLWYGFYSDFASTLLELIKTFAPRNYQSWIEGMAKQKQEELASNPGLMRKLEETVRAKLKWSFWKNKEYTYLTSKSADDQEGLVKWRADLIDEWVEIGKKDGESETVDQSKATESDAALLVYLVDSCIELDRPQMRDLYRYIVNQYEDGKYTFIEAISVLFQRRWILASEFHSDTSK